jgi:hypothetical protein
MENIAKLAISSLEEEFKLPVKGFLAGGAIANRIFELRWGRKMPINDLDIFYFNPEILDIEFAYQNNYIIEDKKCFHAELKDDFQENNYGDYIHQTKTKTGYLVESVNRDEMLNEIYIKASHLDPLLILQSFDLNCTQIGYDLETKKLYYTQEWLDFIENKKIQLTSLHTPCHSLLRIFKKSDEFGLPIEEGEFELIRYCLDNPIGFQRRLFSDKYKEMGEKYKYQLEEKKFGIFEQEGSSNFLSNKIGKEIKLWSISSTKDKSLFGENPEYYFKGWDLMWVSVISNSTKLIWAYRNIYPKKELHGIWNNLHKLWELDISFDELLKLSNTEITFLSSLYKKTPTLIKHIEVTGCTFKQHLDYIYRIWRKFEPNVALSLCQKLNIPIDWNESDEILMELSVRWKSSNDRIIKHSNEMSLLYKNIEYIEL